jgi:hypothetical protein
LEPPNALTKSGRTVAESDVALGSTWFDPSTGERVEANAVSKGTHRFVLPWGSENWAVLHVRLQTLHRVNR